MTGPRNSAAHAGRARQAPPAPSDLGHQTSGGGVRLPLYAGPESEAAAHGLSHPGLPLRVASACSSVGGLDLGLHRAGLETVFFCEFEPWRRKVLARHWPGVPIHHDLKELRASDVPECDLFVGGTPCQDLSHAGRRAGLDGERSGLFHAFAQLRLDLFELHGCAWSLWENVGGALSSNGGRDFATVLASHVGGDVPVPTGGWGGCGVVTGPWGSAEWRVLDAQFFGVPQRRRRVFVVGHLGAEHPSSVLADGPRGPWDLEARREARADAAAGPAGGVDVSGTLGARGKEGGNTNDLDRIGAYVTGGRGYQTSGGKRIAHTLTAGGFDASEDGTGRGTPMVAAPLLKPKGVDSDASDGQIVVASALDTQQGGGRRQLGPGAAHRHVSPRTVSTLMAAEGRGYRIGAEEAAGNQIIAATLTSGSHGPGVSPGRATPPRIPRGGGVPHDARSH